MPWNFLILFLAHCRIVWSSTIYLFGCLKYFIFQLEQIKIWGHIIFVFIISLFIHMLKDREISSVVFNIYIISTTQLVVEAYNKLVGVWGTDMCYT